MIIYTGNGHQVRSRYHGILVTDLSVRVAAFDCGAASILADVQTNNGHHPNPSALPQEIVSILTTATPGELDNRSISFPLTNGECICRVSVLRSCKDESAEPMLALHLRRATDFRQEIEAFAAEHDLTLRERQTLLGIANGLTCKEIAEKLKLSPNTVKSFLRLLMGKIGVARRGEIISKLLEHQRYRT